MKRKTWRCFFCDEVFKSRKAAWAHFGESNCEIDTPACIDPLRKDEKARMQHVRELRVEIRKACDERDRIEERFDGLQSEHDNFFRNFGADCKSMWVASDRYKNALYELDLLRSRQIQEKSA